VRGNVARKVATNVSDADPIMVVDSGPAWVSRGAHKLIGALDAWPQIDVSGRPALDAGASTGGFTQVLLSRGALGVIAVDVGYGQLAWSLRMDDRVHVLDRVNIRSLAPEALPWTPSVIVADLSFISLTTVLPALASVCAPGGDMLLMVKPQFEVGREAVGSGVVREPLLRCGAVNRVAQAARDQGLRIHGIEPSPLPGPSGNVEYFLWLSTPDGLPRERPESLAGAVLLSSIEAAVDRGPT